MRLILSSLCFILSVRASNGQQRPRARLRHDCAGALCDGPTCGTLHAAAICALSLTILFLGHFDSLLLLRRRLLLFRGLQVMADDASIPIFRKWEGRMVDLGERDFHFESDGIEWKGRRGFFGLT